MPPGCAAVVVRAAEIAYPEECCGLVVGRRDVDGSLRITEAIPGRNCAPPPRRDRFEVDPSLRFSVMRRLRGSAEDVVGHFHSHPDGPVEPSARDAAMAFEPDLLWFLVGVAAGRAGRVRAFRWEPDAGRFLPEPLAIDHEAGPAWASRHEQGRSR